MAMIVKPKPPYSVELGEEMLRAIMEGQTDRAVCYERGWSRVTLREWAYEHPEFRARYEAACAMRAHMLVEAAVDRATDEPLEDSPVKVARAKLGVDTIKWYASKILRKDYGDEQKIDVTSGGAPVAVTYVVAQGPAAGPGQADAPVDEEPNVNPNT